LIFISRYGDFYRNFLVVRSAKISIVKIEVEQTFERMAEKAAEIAAKRNHDNRRVVSNGK